MGRSVRISEEDARVLTEEMKAVSNRVLFSRPALAAKDRLNAALARLDRIPKSKPKREHPCGSVRSRKPSKEEKRDRRASIRERVFARAAEGTLDGVPRCEGPLGSSPRLPARCINPATDLQHVFGRGKGRRLESERNCLAACRMCHEAEGRNEPSGAEWWDWFAQWFQDRGFTAEARAARSRARFERTRAALPAAPRRNHEH